MAIQPLNLPPIINVPQLNFAPLNEIGDAIAGYRQRNALADQLPALLGQQQGSSLATLGQPPQQPPATPPAPQAPGSAASAIAGIESGGKYDLLGPVTRTGDRAYGKYQVMGANIGPWSKEVLGREVTPQEFLANPQIQDAIFGAKFGQYAQKYGPEGAARAWFAGEGGMNDPGRRDQLGTSVADYARKFTLAYNGDKPPLPSAITQGPQAAQAQPQSAPQPASQPQPTAISTGLNQPMVERLQAMIRAGGRSEQMALALIQKYAAPQYDFKVAGDTLYRTNALNGSADPIASADKWQFGVIREDPDGNKEYGFANPRTRQAVDLQGRPVQLGGSPKAQGEGEEAAVPPGVNATQYRKTLAKEKAEIAVAFPKATQSVQSASADLDRLKTLAQEIKDNANVGRITGIPGMLPSVPGWGAADLEAKLDTLKSQIGFNVLHAMREASKTGGALGNVSDRENLMLQNNLAALSQKQSPEAFKENLGKIIEYAEGAKKRLMDAYRETYRGQIKEEPKPSAPKVESSAEVSQSLTNAREAVRSGKWTREQAIKKLTDGGVPPELANKI